MTPFPSVIWRCNTFLCRSQWPRCLRRRSIAAPLLELWVRIPPRAWMFVLCCIRTVVWNVKWHEGRKGFKQYKNGSKGENPGQTKKNRLGHGCLSLVNVVCCQVEVSATGWSLVQRSPTECGVSKKCVIVKPRKMRQPRPPRGCRAIGKIHFCDKRLI
jgi:hypothetical protein